MRIYFDVCALGRLTDDQTQPRIRDEAEAVENALRLVRLGIHQWVTSPAMLEEVSENPNQERRQDAFDLLAYATTEQPLTEKVADRALRLHSAGLDEYDALHLAAAIESGCNALLTTDDRFIRRAARLPDVPANLVRYPKDL